MQCTKIYPVCRGRRSALQSCWKCGVLSSKWQNFCQAVGGKSNTGFNIADQKLISAREQQIMMQIKFCAHVY